MLEQLKKWSAEKRTETQQTKIINVNNYFRLSKINKYNNKNYTVKNKNKHIHLFKNKIIDR